MAHRGWKLARDQIGHAQVAATRGLGGIRYWPIGREGGSRADLLTEYPQMRFGEFRARVYAEFTVQPSREVVVNA